MLSLLDLLAVILFFCCWGGYTLFARRRAKVSYCIARSLHQHRIHWMLEVIGRTNRIGDVALLANLERNIAFFASSTLLILAGILTLFAKVDTLQSVLSEVHYTEVQSVFGIQMKLMLLLFIFVLSFFQFTWSMRQYGFVNVMIGAIPNRADENNNNLQAYAKQMAVVQDQAAHSYNYGLRSYYFALAAISWFFHPVLFIIVSLCVVYTLYRREFNSKTVKSITQGLHYLHAERNHKIFGTHDNEKD